jgi:hypothetical protein
MNKPSERIVVFVTPAQKRAIAASAEKLGISVSELMRRAVLSFDETSEQVKAASIVDRLRAPREPDALDAALGRVAPGTHDTRAALPAVLRKAKPGATAAGSQREQEDTLLPADVLAALVRTPEDERAAAEEQAVARIAAAKAATIEAAAVAPRSSQQHSQPGSQQTAPQNPPQPRVAEAPRRRVRLDTTPDEDDPRNDPTTEGGHFA